LSRWADRGAVALTIEKFDGVGELPKMGSSMLGEFSKVDRGLQKKTLSRRGLVVGLQRRQRTRDEVPTWGQIVRRSSNQILR
jgi:hypothetical protein